MVDSKSCSRESSNSSGILGRTASGADPLVGGKGRIAAEEGRMPAGRDDLEVTRFLGVATGRSGFVGDLPVTLLKIVDRGANQPLGCGCCAASCAMTTISGAQVEGESVATVCLCICVGSYSCTCCRICHGLTKRSCCVELAHSYNNVEQG